ncbi:outer membrane beta-barrel protein [Geothrix sp. 21YS21S-2]|uniref:outer membrane beta-barrel protein n=1 Tax=Geothrix sp. 21YS21S-2 TaxID=3068893 RepID=UPI0027B9E537|nr:outer membrane beta-barrel protein [Geothrix sp. 21YS21S-2]
MSRSSALVLAGFALLAAPALRATDLDSPLRFGLQVTAARPLQDLKAITGQTGTGGGLFFETDQGQGWTVRTRLDVLAFKENAARARGLLNDLVAPRAVKVSANQFSVGVELRHGVPGFARPFLLGGVTLSRVEFGTVGPVPSGSGIGWDKQKTSVKMGFAAGGGYRFTDALAFALRYTTISVSGVTLAAFEGGLEYRF